MKRLTNERGAPGVCWESEIRNKNQIIEIEIHVVVKQYESYK